MRTPAPTSSRAAAIATPCGVAKNTTSQLGELGAVGLDERQIRDAAVPPIARRLANMSDTRVPASLRDVIARTSACGMLGEEPQQLDARVPGAADDADLQHAMPPS